MLNEEIQSLLLGPGAVYTVCVALVEVHEEDQVVPEHGEAVHGGHLDDEGEQIVYEGVQELIHEGSPG
eukprot:CAMPEP_0173268868 /NCGR_PEP_ID=MMETSP1142-20121109/30556_1 /TAXON_ID=483371 /ORGANISM="non described non described, Strain CCMP2298" /LENGTH=67 /DNA_ID=CAMNT_0014205139 /DNA_START=240 /DNA_END=443 /DNA_ORIENTATION=-